MSFQTIAGQARVKQMLQNGLRNNKVSHAYLFHGPAGTGKKKMALTLAKAVFCTSMTDDACGGCLECRKTENSNHPDLHIVQPEGSSIKIEQIRTLQKQFSYRSAGSQTKIYIIEQADRMTVQAANSLLKFLEEPQSQVVAILITDNAHAVLPTIQSRAQWIPFLPMTPQDMIRLLSQEGMSELLARPAAHLTSGLEAARELIQLNWFAEIRSVMIQLAKECISRFTSAMITFHHKFVKTDLMDHIETLFDLFMLWFKDMIHIQCGRKENIVFIDQADWLSKHAFTRDGVFWVECMEKAIEMKKRLRYHANPQLVLEQFMIGIEGGEC